MERAPNSVIEPRLPQPFDDETPGDPENAPIFTMTMCPAGMNSETPPSELKLQELKLPVDRSPRGFPQRPAIFWEYHVSPRSRSPRESVSSGAGDLPPIHVRDLPLWRETPYAALVADYDRRQNGETGETGEPSEVVSSLGFPLGSLLIPPIVETGETYGETVETGWVGPLDPLDPLDPSSSKSWKLEKPENRGKPLRPLKECVEAAVELKHRCRLRAARGCFVALALERPAEVQVWLEFVRFEMECGEFRNAAKVITAGLALHPGSLPLLQRKIRVAERLRNAREIEVAAMELRRQDTQRALKASLDAYRALARLGELGKARAGFEAVLQQPRYSAGNFVLEWLQFESPRAGFGEQVQYALKALEQFPKYGPLWFEALDRLEHECLLQWEAEGFQGRVESALYVKVAKRAVEALTLDVLWRAFFFRMQFFGRCLMCLQRNVMRQVGSRPRTTTIGEGKGRREWKEWLIEWKELEGLEG